MMHNFFNDNLDAFIGAYKKILSECVEFNGLPIEDSPTRPLHLLANNFSQMEEDAMSYLYPVKIIRDNEVINAFAEINVNGEVNFL